MDVERLVQLLEGFLSVDNSVRKLAENVFNGSVAENPNAMVVLMLQLLDVNSPAERRRQVAVCFRQFFKGEKTAFSTLSDESVNLLKQRIFEILLVETDKVVCNGLSTVVREMGTELYECGKWPDLLSSILCLINNENNYKSQAVGLEICATLEPFMSKELAVHEKELIDLMMKKLMIEDDDIRINVAGLVRQFLFEDENLEKYKQFVPIFLHLLDSFKTNESLVRFIEQLGEASEHCPRWYRDHIYLVFDSMLPKIVSCTDDTIKRGMAELLLRLVSGMPDLFKMKFPQHVEKLIEVFMTFLLDVKECHDDDEQANLSEWTETEVPNEESREEDNNLFAGEDGLDQVARSLGGDFAIPIIFKYVGEYLSRDEWFYKVGGLIAIRQTTEFLPNPEAELNEVMPMLISAINHPHPRVRYTGYRAICQVSLDHEPYVQRTFHEQLMPSLVNGLHDKIIHVQVSATSALINFVEGLDEDELLPHLNLIMSYVECNISSPITNWQTRKVVEQCITTAAVVAAVMKQDFLPFLPNTISHIKTILQTNSTENIKGRCLECVFMVAQILGIHNVAEIDYFASILINLFNNPPTDEIEDETINDYIEQSLQRFIASLEDATNIVPQVLPRIMNMINLKNSSDDGQEDYTFISVLEEGWSQIQTTKLNEIKSGLNLLTILATSMKQKFIPWVQDAAAHVKLLLPIMSDSVGAAALECFAALISCLTEKVLDNQGKAIAHQMLLDIIDSIFPKLDQEKKPLDWNFDLDQSFSTLSKCCIAAGNDILEPSEILAISFKAFQHIDLSNQRSQKLHHNRSVDLADKPYHEAEVEVERNFREGLVNLVGSIIATHPRAYLQTVGDQTKVFLDNALAKSNENADKTLALLLACDIIEHCPDAFQFLGNQFYSTIILETTNNDAEIRQLACYALSLAFAHPGIDPVLVQEGAKRFVIIAKDSLAHNATNRSATDNAVSALITAVANYPLPLNSEITTIVDTIVTSLPITGDITEGVKVHTMLLDLLQQVNRISLSTIHIPAGSFAVLGSGKS